MSDPAPPSAAIGGEQLRLTISNALSYLRISTKTKHETWFESNDLLSGSDTNGRSALATLVTQTGLARGIDRGDIALSLFAQAYAFRIASTALAGWILTQGERHLDVSSGNTAIAIGRNRPNAVGLESVTLSEVDIHENLFANHLTPFVKAAHQTASRTPGMRVGAKMLWGNVGAGVASTFGVFSAIVGQDPSKVGSVPNAEQVRLLADEFMQGAPAELTSSGEFVLFKGAAPQPLWAWERASCCLWYQVEPADPEASRYMCTDCSLWTPEERTARYEAATGVST